MSTDNGVARTQNYLTLATPESESEFTRAAKIKALPEGGQRLNYKYVTYQGRVLIHVWIWIP